MKNRNRGARRPVGATVLAVVALLASGCSSSDAADGTTGATETTTDTTVTTTDGSGGDGADAADFAEVATTMDDVVAEQGLEGAGLVIVQHDDGVIHEHYSGDFDADRISLLASASKMVTAGVLLRLADDGVLDLDAPVADVVDWGAGNPEITPAQLLSNSSGLVGLVDDPTFAPYICQYLASGTLSECAREIFTTTADDDAGGRAGHRVPIRRRPVAGGGCGGRSCVGEVVGGVDRRDLRRAVSARLARVQQPLRTDQQRRRPVHLPGAVRRRSVHPGRDGQPQHGGRRLRQRQRLLDAVADAAPGRSMRRRTGAERGVGPPDAVRPGQIDLRGGPGRHDRARRPVPHRRCARHGHARCSRHDRRGGRRHARRLRVGVVDRRRRP